MSHDQRHLDVRVDVPALQVELPQATGRTVQSLDPDESIRIGHHVGDQFALLPLGPPSKPRAPAALAVRVAIDLGDDVEVRRGNMLDVWTRGGAVVSITDQPRVDGQIVLDHGKLEIEGKQFMIDHGTVSFAGGDPEDPLIIATATWDAPDGTRVFADFSGRLSSGKLALRSDPSLTQDQILALILFGSPEGSFGVETPQGQQEAVGAKALGMAGSLVAQGLNKAISGITTARITTRVDTSRVDEPRPELAVQISRNVSARLSYKLGVPAPGENPDRTELTFDWRFVRDWSVVATVGDQGSTTLDVVWRLRY
jgi:translocation and assembly module TamB